MQEAVVRKAKDKDLGVWEEVLQRENVHEVFGFGKLGVYIEASASPAPTGATDEAVLLPPFQTNLHTASKPSQPSQIMSALVSWRDTIPGPHHVMPECCLDKKE
ncbi:predicted protein [Coccidioides posadasii str. Silveira]|uniref:Predicted protein n=1 Tax=Coccidioides posadasii (strain RMSCC 757 / Silveira) TaxID=443226 RepID=E9D1Y8_COCPS|nr:predicted protein [Coccidioides posadasii str. Silveira]